MRCSKLNKQIVDSCWIGCFLLGRYSHHRYNIDTEINRYGHHAVSIQMMVTDPPPKKKQTTTTTNNGYSGPKTIGFTLNFHTIKENIELILC